MAGSTLENKSIPAYRTIEGFLLDLSDEKMPDKDKSLHKESSIRLYFVLVLCQACIYMLYEVP